MPSFEADPLSWAEAEQAFVSKGIMSADDFYALREAYRGYAFTTTLIQEYAVMIRIKAKLEQIIAEGETIEAFQAWAAKDGIVWTDAYSELVYRMAVQGSYAKARYEAIMDPDIAQEFNLLMYSTADDDRVRDEHAEMDGFTAARNKFPDEWWPQCGFNCRCTIRALNSDLARRAGAKTGRPIPLDEDGNPVRPDKGFRANQNRDYGGMLDAQLVQAKAQLEE